MNTPTLRADHMAASAVLFGGALAALLPHHALNVLRLVIVSLAVIAALHVLALHAPPRWWRSPFARELPRRRAAQAADEIEWVAAMMAQPRQRLRNAPPVPPAVIAALRPLLESAAARHAVTHHGQEATMSPLAQAIVQAPPPPRHWLRLLPGDARSTARVVDAILDEVDRISQPAP